MSNRDIILATILMLFISFMFLAYSEKKQADINTKNIWIVYFENPKTNSLDFTIENHSDNNDFQWQVLANKSLINQANTIIKNGKQETIKVSVPDTEDKKITIIVKSGYNKKEIYKNL